MRRLTILVALALTGMAGTAEAAKPTSKPTAAAKPTMVKTQAPKGHVVKPATVQGAPAKSSIAKASMKGPTVKAARGSTAKPSTVKPTRTQVKTSGAKSSKPAIADAKLAAKPTKVEAKSGTAGSTSATTSTSRTSNTNVATNSVDFTATSVGQKLGKNSALRSKIEAKLKAAGYTGSVYEAAYGFKNVGQFNAATNQVQNHGYSFELLKVLMTGTYVDPDTHIAYRTSQLADGTITLVSADSVTNPASTMSLGQSKRAIAGGAEMPELSAVGPSSTSAKSTVKRRGSF